MTGEFPGGDGNFPGRGPSADNPRGGQSGGNTSNGSADVGRGASADAGASASAGANGNAGGNGNGNAYGKGYGNGPGNSGSNGNGGGGGGGGGAPLPLLGVTLLGQVVGGGGLYLLWRRRCKQA